MNLTRLLPATLLAGTLLAAPAFAQTTASSPAKSSSTTAGAAPAASEAEMMEQMMELAKLNENHKLLGELVGTWDYTAKFWMNPDASAAPTESKGTAVRKPIMEGRYFTVETTGRFPMPGPDGKMQDMNFKGTSLEGYDNVKKKFVSTWADNMSTGIMMSEGTYDPATKTFTYTAEAEMMPGMTTKVRGVIKMIDKDHYVFEWYDNARGTEAKTMEISYTRRK